MTDVARTRVRRTAGLAVFLALFIATAATNGARAQAKDTFHGSATTRITDAGISIERFDQSRFPDFARESLARHFKLGNPVQVHAHAGSDRIHDIELVGPSRCLASDVSRAGWQKLRFEFEYQLDWRFRENTGRTRFEFLLRVVYGYVADYPFDSEPPAERFKQMQPHELGDIASKLAGFMRGELGKNCFDKQGLRYCPATTAGPCR